MNHSAIFSSVDPFDPANAPVDQPEKKTKSARRRANKKVQKKQDMELSVSAGSTLREKLSNLDIPDLNQISLIQSEIEEFGGDSRDLPRSKDQVKLDKIPEKPV